MLRFLAGLVGVGFVSALLIAFLMPREKVEPTAASVYHLPEKEVKFSFDGPFGRYDRRQLQRGFQVYKEVCSSCHSLKLVAFRDLADLGYDEAEVKASATTWRVELPAFDRKPGDPRARKALPADHFPPPFQN